MRWLLVSSQHHPTHGGIGTYVDRFLRSAERHGWEVDLLTRPSSVTPPARALYRVATADMEPAFAARIDRLRQLERIRPYRYALWSLAVAERLERLLREGKRWDAIEFVDCQGEGLASLGTQSLRDALRSTPCLVHAHTPMWIDERVSGADPTRFGRSIYHAWEKRAIAMADGVIATSRRLAGEFLTRVPPAVIPYPIDLDEALQPEVERCEEILLVGAVQPRKGVAAWARSLNQVLRNYPRATAVLVGPDTPTAPSGTSMVEYATSLLTPALRGRFRWLGARSHEETLARIRRAALVVVPSVFESFSFAAVEAIDQGTPVILSDCVGLAEHLPGLITVKTGDVDELASAQSRVLSAFSEDPKRFVRQGEEMRRALGTTCSSAVHLTRKASFARSLVPATMKDIDGDARQELERFVAEVEAAETAHHVERMVVE